MLRPTTHFYPRPPRGGRLTFLIFLAHLVLISIHALREEGDAVQRCFAGLAKDFYPRPPRGGRQALSIVSVRHLLISIHALREEGDEGGTQ